MKKLLTALLIVSVQQMNAQDINAFTTYNKQFRVFDKGSFMNAEGAPVDTFYLGYNYVAYVSNNKMIKMYWH